MYVMRLLDEKDVTSRLLKREIYLLWPDDGVWYPAQVREVQILSLDVALATVYLVLRVEPDLRKR